MKRMSSSSDLIKKASTAGEHNILEDKRSQAPPKPPRTFSRVKAQKHTHSNISSESTDFNDSFDEDISENFTALVEKSFEQLEITPTSRPAACDSKCLREWVLRMCLLEKLEKTALDALDAMEVVEDDAPGEVEIRDNTGWMGPKLAELMEPPRKRRKFCSKFFRNLSPSRLLLKQKKRQERKRANRRLAEKPETAESDQKNRTFSSDKCRMNLSRVPGFFFRTFWKDGTKHTEL